MSPRSSLAGRAILVTRPRDRSEHLVRALRERGARAIEAPAIELRPVRSAALTRAMRDLEAGAFAWVVLTSPATVGMLADRLASPRQVRARVAAVGDGTAATFHRWAGREPDLVPQRFTTAALADAFPPGHGRVLTARADIAPSGLEQSLEAKGYDPLRVDAYRTSFPRTLPADARAALAAGDVDAITFTSASTVRGFVGAAGLPPRRTRVVCIGPVTAREARAHGLRVHGVADPHTTQGLVARLERLFARQRRLSS